jgi:hypothetical protein
MDNNNNKDKNAAILGMNQRRQRPEQQQRRLFPYLPKSTGFTCDTRQSDPIFIQRLNNTDHFDTNQSSTATTTTSEDGDNDFFLVRACNCGGGDIETNVYCPADAYYCIITPLFSSRSSSSTTTPSSNLAGNYRYLNNNNNINNNSMGWQNSEYRVICAGAYSNVHLQILFPLMLFMFLFLTLALFRTPRGRYCRGYIRRCIGCWDEERYYADLNVRLDRMYERQRVHRMRLQRLRDLENSGRVVFPATTILHPPTEDWRRDTTTRSVAAALPVQPQQIVCLNTKVYRRHHEQPSQNDGSHPMAVSLPSTSSLPGNPGPHENENTATRVEITEIDEQEHIEEDDICTICLLEFREGDIVGDIPCGHMFHKDCLKSWIRRRKNHCPLCLRDNMTTAASPEHVGSQQQRCEQYSSPMEQQQPTLQGEEETGAMTSLPVSPSSTIELATWNPQ